MEIFKDVLNYYGGLAIEKVYYWAIENYDGFRWEPIPYNELKKFALENME